MGRPKLTVLHVVESMFAGVGLHVSDIVSHVQATHVVVAPRPGRGRTDPLTLERVLLAGAAVELIEMHRAPAHPANFRAIARVHRLIRAAGADIVHGHSSIGGAIGRAAAIRTGAVTVYTPNGLMPNPLTLGLEIGLRPLTDCFVAVSQSEAALARRLKVSGGQHLAVIPNGVDLTARPPLGENLRSSIGLADLVGFAGRLSAQKAPLDLISAWPQVVAAHPSATLVIIGDGPLRSQVEHAVAASPHRSSICLLGARDAGPLLGQFDVLVVPSRYEGLPYVVLEAMRSGTPVVVSDCVGNRDTVEHRVSGLIFPVGDIDAIASAVNEILAMPAAARRLAGAARTRLAERFDVTEMAAALAETYERLAAA